MTNKKLAENRQLFYCKFCDYSCRKQSDFNKHLNTTKHKILINPNKKVAELAKAFMCSCGKSYKHASSLSNHKKKCTIIDNVDVKLSENKEDLKYESDDNVNYKEMFLEMMKQNQELQKNMMQQNQNIQQTMQKTMQEMIPNIGNNNNNKTNNINLQIFLNEQCKDALNIMDFVNSLKLQLKDLENTGKLGFVEGTSKIMIDGLKELELHKRPIHCSDLQNEILYVKDDNTWKQDTDNKDTMKKAIDEISKANMKQLPKWMTDNPTYADDEEYMQIVSNIMKMDDIEDDKTEIIKKVSKEVIL
tara:strand:- start:6384 stop:7292 length:909 start_codon:yes stop_codon:yes gene_type:complete